jgi:hypothetical protein
MTVCDICNQTMPAAATCTERKLEGSGRSWIGVRYGDERRYSTESDDFWADDVSYDRRPRIPWPPVTLPERCVDCGVEKGAWHHLGCDMEECPRCGWQLISCGCWFDDGDDPWDP